jgi:uncharacterized protein with FMN-binding domain
MRRVVLALLATMLGSGLMIGLKSRPIATLATPLAEAPLAPGESGAPGATGPDGSPVPGQAASPGASGSAGTSAAPGGPAPTTGTSTAPSSRPPTTSAAPPASRTLTGTAVAASGFGSMQVRIVVTNKHIDSISTVRQSNRPGNTANVLTPLALSAQAVPSGSCKTLVSGATYSCEAWKQSLQSAISQI